MIGHFGDGPWARGANSPRLSPHIFVFPHHFLIFPLSSLVFRGLFLTGSAERFKLPDCRLWDILGLKETHLEAGYSDSWYNLGHAILHQLPPSKGWKTFCSYCDGANGAFAPRFVCSTLTLLRVRMECIKTCAGSVHTAVATGLYTKSSQVIFYGVTITSEWLLNLHTPGKTNQAT